MDRTATPVQLELAPIARVASSVGKGAPSPLLAATRAHGRDSREHRRVVLARPRTPPTTVVDTTSDERRLSIWDGDRQAFRVGTLKQVMLVRGFTAETLAVAAGVARGTMYNALAGRATRLTTARRILEALAAVEPRLLLSRIAANV